MLVTMNYGKYINQKQEKQKSKIPMKKEQLFILSDGEYKRLGYIDNVTLEGL